MNWLTDPDRVKVQWRLVYLNLAAVALNAVIGIMTWKLMSIANLFSAAFSAWVAWTMYKKIPAIKAEQERRIVDILSGKIQPHYID